MQGRYLDILRVTILKKNFTLFFHWTKHPQQSGTHPETPAERQTLRNPQG